MPNKNARLLYIYGDNQFLNLVYYILLFIYLYRYIIYNFINLFYELHFLLKFRYLVFYDFYFNKDMQGFCLVVATKTLRADTRINFVRVPGHKTFWKNLG